MSRLFNGSSDKMRIGTGNIAGAITFSAWIYPTNVTGTHYIMTISESGVDSPHRALLLSGTSVLANHYDGDSQFASIGTVSINTWHHVAASFVSNSSRFAWLDGTKSTENTVTQTGLTAIDHATIGVLEFTVDTGHFAGRIEDACFYNGATSQLFADQMAAGFAMQAPMSMFTYNPMVGDYSNPRDLINGPLWTLTGTTRAVSPPGLVRPDATHVSPLSEPTIIDFGAASWPWAAQALDLKADTTNVLTAPAFNWAAQSLDLKADTTHALTAPAFNWAAQAVNIKADTLVDLTAAAWSWAAQSLTILAATTVDLAAATWSWAAQAINTKADTLVDFAAATWSWAAQAISTKADTLVDLSAASWSWAAQAISTKADTLVDLTAAAWSWAAQAITIISGSVIALTAASWNWAAQAITLKTDTLVALAAASWNWAAQAITVTAAGPASLIRNLAQNLSRGLTRVLAKTTDDE